MRSQCFSLALTFDQHNRLTDEAEIFDLFSCESQELVKTQFRCSCFRKSTTSLFVMAAGLNDPGRPYRYVILCFKYLPVTAISRAFINECLCPKKLPRTYSVMDPVMKLYLRETPIQERMKIETKLFPLFHG